MRSSKIQQQGWLAAWLAVGIIACASAALRAQGTYAPQAGEEEKLIAVLEQADASLFDKAKACQRLAVVGTQKAVPALARLLQDEKLAHYARFGLEPIPDPSADEALRQAAASLEGNLRVGAINSIGVRRDAGAQAMLIELLGHSDETTAAAAAAALGSIGTPRAANTLQPALASAQGARRAAVAAACLRCSEMLLRRGKRQRARAIELYDAVRGAEVAKHIRMAALRGAILARRAEGVPLLLESIEGSDADAAEMAFTVARDVMGPRCTRGLIDLLGRVSAEKKEMVIAALGDRGDRMAQPALLDAARSDAASIRLAAIRALRTVGDASSVAVLLDAAAGDGEEAAAALDTLERLRTEGVDDAITAALDGGPDRLRPVLIELAGKRRIESATAALRKAADDADDKVRLAAIGALGLTIGLKDLAMLTERVMRPRSDQERAAAQEALKVACRRQPDRDACAAKLKEAMAEAPADAKVRLMEVFVSVGGEAALRAVAACFGDSSEAIREASARVLGEWTSEEAAPVQLELLKGSSDSADRLRVLRGFSALIRRIGFPKEQRIGFCEQAMGLCQDDGERKLVLEALSGIPAPETLDLLASYLARESLKEDVCAVMVQISDRLLRSRRDAVAKAMQKVLEVTKNEELAARARKLLQEAGGRS
ncbi:MAG: HEAT repeat domain-containing protein [Planctomycetes bacterium]|nr:HEAT repeat domain-containing protein [Planctomycetota bacterium]